MLPFSTPFNCIALSLSGGGFRAASFSLGIMSYLDRLDLLKNVEFISSASGGSFAATLYGVYYSKGRPFNECYTFLLDEMKEEGLLNNVLEKLNDDAEWDSPGIGKRRNLINAFAKVYDEEIFAGETFDIFWNQKQEKNISVCFNTTDFFRGLSFRFQTDGDNKSFEYVGNRYIHFDKDNPVYKKIKLADILAASSCFPAGFEPIIFPDDFIYRNLSAGDLKDSMILEGYDGTKEVLRKQLGFMDGGITDNQGLYSAMTADERKRNHDEAFDLIIVGDVTSYFMDPYNPVEEKKEEGLRAQTINGILNKISAAFKKIKIGLIASIAALLTSIIGLLFNLRFGNSIVTATCLVLLGISLTSLVFLGYINNLKNKQKFLNKIFKGDVTPEIRTILEHLNIGNNFSDDIIDKLTKYLGNTKLNVLEQMIKARAASVLTMTMDVNLKHTRRLIYQLFFDNEKWNDRRLYNVLFELSSFNNKNRTYRVNKKLPWARDDDKQLLTDITFGMQEIAEDARTMGTTLWFAKEDVKNEKLKKVVACGQFTTCMNLIEYVLSIERKVESKELNLVENELDKIKLIKEQLLKDWSQFKLDPYFLYNSLS